jgi:predicted MPP superfamily phosphohydrolase
VPSTEVDYQMLQEQRSLRALFLSDIHLGSRACRSDRLIEFLRWHRADAIYLVGDIGGGSALIANTMWRAPCRAAGRAHLRPVRADALLACSDLRR